VFYRKELQHISTWSRTIAITLWILLLIPFFSTFFNPEGVASASGTLIFSSASIQAKLLEVRSYLIELPALFTMVFFNRFALTLWEYIQHMLSYISVEFFFISGSSHGNHGIGSVGQFYIFEFLTILIGMISVFKNKEDIDLLFSSYYSTWLIKK
jgi:hypothetical protein